MAVDQLYDPVLRRARHGAHGKGCPYGLRPAEVRRQFSLYRGDQLVHLGESIDTEQFIHLYRTRQADPGEIVADQVDDHYILGSVLWAIIQSFPQRFVRYVIPCPAWGGALYRLRPEGVARLFQV